MLTIADSGPRLVRVEAAIAWIELGGANTGNMLTRQQMTMLSEAIRLAGADPDVSVVAIAPGGGAFCLGRNGKGEPAEALPWDARQRQMGVTLDVYDAIAACPIPVVACVQGNAIGFGAALAGGCDITLAARSARFALPEIKHSIPATLAMSALIRKIPEKALAHLIYSGEEISAEDALALGLVSKVFPAETFEESCSAYLLALASRKRLLLETIKRYIAKAPQLSPEMASEYAGTLMALVKPSL
ncbi:MAG: enoyl-CoA hydratase/isomerase family protein [Chelatococcus sp.]|uniref:enoyl-CoA hydratase/isomerase family protein n=1 Tax=Chelatococcus sp. TaxID=1953771 RepID=UPI0025BCFB6B|nr:enoyl-CoA hydratase/isomerase family protein [Chelatococcus sp.]MBX3539844.1 enoyl-CoA hydratase/isomerase family protein [Chelatococcus sp.]